VNRRGKSTAGRRLTYASNQNVGHLLRRHAGWGRESGRHWNQVHGVKRADVGRLAEKRKRRDSRGRFR
jgi:hypothetical protein